jgi:hypothetical protein
MGPGFWKLKKALYGLKKAGHQWHLTLNTAFIDIGYTRSQTDWSVHFKHNDVELVGLSGTIVDDIILSTSTKLESDRFASEASRQAVRYL